MRSKGKKLAVIDGKSVFYRGYYAMPNLATKDGTPTGGVFGFATMAFEVIKKLKPDYVCVAWDKPKTNIRKRLELYSEYKAGRKPAPADFYEQVPILHELLKAFGWPLYELDDYEADDIMGTLAVQARAMGLETLLITSDLDLLQVINGNVKVYALKKGLSNIELYSPKSFEAKYGLAVNQFLDLKALKGDSSDNIPGVPGVGEKTATELLKTYKTLDGVYENLPLIKENLRKKLEAGKSSAYLSKKLGAIWTDAPIKLNLDEVDGRHIDAQKLAEMLIKLEFRSLARQVPEVLKVDLHAGAKSAFQLPGSTTVKVVNNPSQLKILDVGKTSPVIVHSFARQNHGSEPQWLFLSTDGRQTFALDLTKLDHSACAKVFEGRAIVGYDAKKTLKILLELGAKNLPVVLHDVFIAAFLINSLAPLRTLTELAEAELGYAGDDFENYDTQETCTRAGETLSVIKALYESQVQTLAKLPKISRLAERVEWPLLPVLARMERAGIELDTAYLKRFSSRLKDQLSDIEQQIYGHADAEFNIASPTQLASILFEQLKLPTAGIKKGKTGYSTAASELDKLRGQHAIVELISQYREVAKLLNTYVETLPKLVDKSSRVHTTFNLTIAQTGRLSSTDPNLQNIPVRTELGRNIRTAFVAGHGKKLVSADYSQFELRLAAALSDDQEVIDMFNRGADVHTMTAAQVYGREPEDVTKQMRYAAKAVNFGIMYGQGPHALALGTGMTYEQAKTFIDKYFEIRSKLKSYIEKTREQAKEQGYVETIMGRRRPTPDVRSSNFAVREAAYRAAVNMPMQGSAADIMKLAMIAADVKLRALDPHCQMLLQIHDSILVECPAALAEAAAKILKDTMENIYPELPVKLIAETTIGSNWGEL